MSYRIRIASTPAERAAWHSGEQPPAAEERKPPRKAVALSDAPIERQQWPETRSKFEGPSLDKPAKLSNAVLSGPRCTFSRYREIPHFDHRCGFCNAIYPRELAINVWGCESCEEMKGMGR